MKDFAFLDTGPLGLACANPSGSPDVREINTMLTVWQERATVVLPEIADYELRRELVRRRATRGLRRLDQLRATLHFLPINSEAMKLAAELWAQIRRDGQATADDSALDGDVIIAAQTRVFTGLSDNPVVITENNRHLGRFDFVKTSAWQTYFARHLIHPGL